jgi:hypothetical protein
MPEALLQRAPSLLLALGLGLRIVVFVLALLRRLRGGIVERRLLLFSLFGIFAGRFLRRCGKLAVFVAVLRRLHLVG